MKIKLKLTDNQIHAFATVLKYTLNTITNTDFESIQYSDALTGLLLNLIKKMPLLRPKNSFSLTEIEALALYNLLGNLADRFQPYEKCLIYNILSEIDMQKHLHLSLKRANIVRLELTKIE